MSLLNVLRLRDVQNGQKYMDTLLINRFGYSSNISVDILILNYKVIFYSRVLCAFSFVSIARTLFYSSRAMTLHKALVY